MFKNLNIKWKISLIIILLIMLVMVIVAIIIYSFTSNTHLEQINDKISIMSQYEKNRIVEVKNNIETRVTRIINNTTLKYYVETVYEDYLNGNSGDISDYQINFNGFIKSVSIGQNIILKNFKKEISYISFIYVTTVNGIVIADSRQNMSKDPMTYIGKKLEINRYKNVKIGSLEYVNGKPLLFMNRPIYNQGNKVIGYFIIALHTDIFSANLNRYLSSYGKISLINRKGQIINNNGEEVIGDKIKNKWFLNQINKNIETRRHSTDDNLLILNKIPETDVYFAVEIPLSKINAPAKQISNIIIFIILLSTLIIFLIVTFVINSQLKPLFLLSNNINKVRKGNLDVRIDIDRTDVIGNIAVNFNKMVVDIKELLQKVKEDQEKIRKYELQALQSQINPHFLYNTLDSINWMSRAKDYQGISEVTVALSKFFRLSLNEGEDITSVSNEIEHVKNYIKIQKLRYPRKFKYEIKVDSELYSKECIKLILQPLVENSIKHGLGKTREGGLIKIIGKIKNGNLILQVYDNGKGFDPEEMDYIVTENKNTGKYSALNNVERRIKLYYGQDYGLNFYLSEEELSCVEIKLPIKNYKGDQYVKNDYSR